MKLFNFSDIQHGTRNTELFKPFKPQTLSLIPHFLMLNAQCSMLDARYSMLDANYFPNKELNSPFFGSWYSL